MDKLELRGKARINKLARITIIVDFTSSIYFWVGTYLTQCVYSFTNLLSNIYLLILAINLRLLFENSILFYWIRKVCKDSLHFFFNIFKTGVIETMEIFCLKRTWEIFLKQILFEILSGFGPQIIRRNITIIKNSVSCLVSWEWILLYLLTTT